MNQAAMEAKAQRPGKDPNATRLVAAQQVALLFNQASVAVASAWLGGILVAMVLWSVVPEGRMIAWVSLLTAVTGGRLLLVYFFRRAEPAPDKYPRWRDRAVISSGMIGIVWGLVGTWLFPESSLPHQMFIGFMLAGLTAASMPFLSPVWPAYVTMLIPTTLPYTFRLLEVQHAIAQTMALLILLFSAIMLYASRRMHHMVTESLQLRYDKQVLSECLGQTVDELDMANAVREQAKRVARESERRAQILADAPFEGIFVHENGKILDANRTVLNMLGLSLEAVMGKQVIDFVTEESRELVAKELNRPSSEVFLTRATRPDGSTIDLEVRGRHFPCQGRTVRVVSLRPRD